MMRYGYEYGGDWGLMGGGFGFLGVVTWLVIIIDGILLGIWLWQKISKK
ncbi:MAG TPA: hypothetical protein VJK09_02050 [Candidatus Paceibacterota bacterium]